MNALNNVIPCCELLIVVALVFTNCVGSSNEEDNDCFLGAESCQCAPEDVCDPGLHCLSGFCVSLGELDSDTNRDSETNSSTVQPIESETDSEEDTGKSIDREELCERWCNKLDICDSSVDVTDCAKDCAKRTSNRLETEQFFTECAEEASCDEIENWEYRDCAEDQVKMLELSAVGESACTEIAKKAEMCDGNCYDENGLKQECERLVARWYADSLLEDVQNCFKNYPCDGIDNCIFEVADKYNDDSVTVYHFIGIGNSLPKCSSSRSCIGNFNNGCTYSSDCCSSRWVCSSGGYCFPPQVGSSGEESSGEESSGEESSGEESSEEERG